MSRPSNAVIGLLVRFLAGDIIKTLNEVANKIDVPASELRMLVGETITEHGEEALFSPKLHPDDDEGENTFINLPSALKPPVPRLPRKIYRPQRKPLSAEAKKRIGDAVRKRWKLKKQKQKKTAA